MTTLIVDANNLGFRQIGSNMVAGGRQVGIVYSFITALWHAIERYGADCVAIVWDKGKSEWRKALLPEYKVREGVSSEVAQDAFRQLRVLEKDLLPHLPVYQLGVDGTEADDIIYAAVKVSKPFGRVVIYSNDSDFYQLLDKAVIWTGKEEVTKDSFFKEYGFDCTKYTLFKAMVGDHSDKIKGVTGVGEKTATLILRDYPCLKEFADSDHPKAKLLRSTEATEIIKRNMNLIDLSLFPDAASLESYVVEELCKSVQFSVNPFHSTVAELRMVKLMATANMLRRSFMRLER